MTAVGGLYRSLTDVVSGVLARDFPIGDLTTYRLGGRAALYCEPESFEELEAIGTAVHAAGVPFLVIGRGSNLLVSDEGFEGVAVRLGSGFNWSDLTPDGAAAGGATPLPNFARWVGRHGLSGLEFGVGIPASVGGAVKMNAGGHGREICEVLTEADVYSISSGLKTIRNQDLGFGYRRSSVGSDEIVVAARFALAPGDETAIKNAMAEISRWRREHQPGGIPNAGSVFKNPDGDSAGRLIDAAGLKDVRIGGASVSEKHANFFVAGEGATASDVFDLIALVRERVFERFGVVLEPEVRFVGKFPPLPEPGKRNG